MRLLVEISQGVGNCIQATPMVRALWLLGHDVDLFINSTIAGKLRELWDGWECVGRIFTDAEQFDVADYDFGISSYGTRFLTQLFPAGRCLKVETRHARDQAEAEANCDVARWLGYAGPTPPHFVPASDRKFDVPERYVTIHAGCDPAARKQKNWPHWAEFAARLRERGWTVIAIGTESDKSRENWEAEFGADIGFGNPLPDVAALLAGATFHFGNDSSCTHLAAAVNTPGMALFGPSDPVKNRPHNPRIRQLVAEAEPGEDRKVGSRKSVPISRLSLDEVWAAGLEVLADPARHVWPELPGRVADGAESRWQRYVDMTLAQEEAATVQVVDACESPRVSVIIPASGNTEQLARATASARAQGVDCEILVCDDGNDASKCNAGLRRARGEWIAFLAADVEWHPDKLEKQLDALGSDRLAACYGGAATLPGERDSLFRALYEGGDIEISSVMFKRDLLDRVGLFHERFPARADWEYLLRLARTVGDDGFVCLPEPLLTVHRPTARLSWGRRATALEDRYTGACIVHALLESGNAADRERGIRWAATQHLELSRLHRKAAHWRNARGHARQAIRNGLPWQGAHRWLRGLTYIPY
ncbi:MAG: glycosyltransferase family 9 protein [Planctomycetota bacterium]